MVAIENGEILAVTGSDGPRQLVTKADADSATLRDTVLLIASGNIAANGLGPATPWRLLQNVNTDGAAEGDPVYLSATAGGWTLSPPAVAVQVGVVTKVSATTGAILFAPAALRVSSTSLLSEALIDHRVLRADGTAGIQNSLWTITDSGRLTSESATAVWIEITAGDLILSSSTGDVVVDATSGIFQVDVGAAGWSVDGVTATRAQVADWFAIAGLAVTDGNIIVGNGTTWVAESGATARTSLGLGAADAVAFGSLTLVTPLAVAEGGTGADDAAEARSNLGIGPPICAVRTTEFDVTDTEATITFESVPITSTEITHNAGEFTVSVTGRYKVEFTGHGTVTTADANESTMTVLMQDDTASQGSDVNTAGTTRLVVAGPTNGIYGAGIAITHVIDLDSGDTVRFRADRGDVAGTCRIVCGVVMQRIG